MSRKPWDRLPKETPRLFERFVRYRDMDPIERSLSAVAQHFGVSKQAMDQLSRKYKWVARVKAWQDHQDAFVQRRQLNALAEMNARQMKLGRGMQAVATRKLVELKNKDLTPLDVARLGVNGVKIERLAAGESTENLDATAGPAPAETGEEGGRDALRRIIRNPAALRAARELHRALGDGAGGDAGARGPEVGAD